MIAEMVAINAAFGVIKEFVGNGKELYDCGEYLSSFFNNKDALQKKVNSAPPDKRGQLEEFFALEKIKQQEEELRQIMQWTGRPGLWDDWLNFQAQAARARREAEAQERLRIQQRWQQRKKMLEWAMALVIAGVAIWFLVWVVLFILTFR